MTVQTILGNLRRQQAALDALVPSLNPTDLSVVLSAQARLQHAIDSLNELHPSKPHLRIAGDDTVQSILKST